MRRNLQNFESAVAYKDAIRERPSCVGGDSHEAGILT
jgi:hypothetical protein